MDHAGHQRRSAIQGESQARTARSARGQDGAGAGAAARGPPPRTLEAVSRYVIHERPLEAAGPFVFLVGRGRQRCEPLSYDALVKLFSRRMSALGLRTPETTPHALRHTHATAS